jgi:hypothetical protein
MGDSSLLLHGYTVFNLNEDNTMKKVAIIGASGKLGQYMVQHCLDLGYEVVGVCRAKSAHKLDRFINRMTIIKGKTNDRAIIKQAVENCDGVLTVLVPWGVQDYASGTAKAVMDFAPAKARLIFSCGWHITLDGKDVYGLKIRALVHLLGSVARFFRVVDLNDQVVACDAIFNSGTQWTVVRGSDLEEGESQGLPVWSDHVGDAKLKSNLTRRTDFALFMVDALTNNELVQKAPAIVGCQTESASAAHTV